MALAVGEAVAAVIGGPSLVVVVGDVVIDLAPGWLVRRTIDLLGTTQKPALLIGIVVVTLLAGGALGCKVGGGRRTGRAAFVAFGLMGSGAAAWSGASIRGLATGMVAASVGIVVLEAGLRRVPVSGLPQNDPATESLTALPFEDPRVKTATRRGFITYAAGMSVAASAIAAGSHALARRGSEDLRTEVVLPSVRRTAAERLATTTTTTEGSWTPIPGLSSWITPNDGFYRIDTALVVPRVDPASWSMSIEGLVATRLEFTLNDLLGMDLVDVAVTLNCVSNEVGGHLVGNAIWTGVPLADLLAEAGPTAGAQQVMAWSVDGFNAGFPMAAVMDGRTALVAVGMNGEPLPFRHGFPARLIVAGLYGYVSAVKWLDRIQLTTLDDDGYWIPRGWAKYGPIKIASRIDVPVRSAVPAGRQPIAGVAWAPVAGIAGVEVSIDRGPWMACRIHQENAPGLSGDSWVQWFLAWDAEPGAHVLRVRAFDRDGRVQPPGPRATAPDGAEGYHARHIRAT